MYRLFAAILFIALLVPVRAAAATGDEHWDDQFMTNGLNAPALAMLQDGSTLYLGGNFTQAGGTAAAHVVAWNGSAWSALGAGLDGPVYALAMDSGILYAGGDFTGKVARWDGSAWSVIPDGPNNRVQALAASGGVLYVGGDFTMTGAAAAAKYIARWDGSVWSSMGVLSNAPTHRIVVASGTVYAVGTGAPSLSRWNGSAWIRLGLTNGQIHDLHADAAGNLVAAGRFDGPSVAHTSVGRWDGSTWTKLRADTSQQRTLFASALALDTAGRLVAASNIYTDWPNGDSYIGAGVDVLDGGTWTRFAGGLNAGPEAMVFDGDTLYAAGSFSAAGTKRSMHFARYVPTETYSMGVPLMSAAPTSINYGDVPVSAVRGALVDMTNIGTGQATIRQIVIVGHDHEDYRIDILDHCFKNFRVDWACEIGITFQPSATGKRTATLVITYDGPNAPLRVPLVGRGQ